MQVSSGGKRFVLVHQHGCRDVSCKPAKRKPLCCSGACTNHILHVTHKILRSKDAQCKIIIISNFQQLLAKVAEERHTIFMFAQYMIHKIKDGEF